VSKTAARTTAGQRNAYISPSAEWFAPRLLLASDGMHWTRKSAPPSNLPLRRMSGCRQRHFLQSPTHADRTAIPAWVLLLGNRTDDARQLPAPIISEVTSIGLRLLNDGDSHSIEQRCRRILRFCTASGEDPTFITAVTRTDGVFGQDRSMWRPMPDSGFPPARGSPNDGAGSRRPSTRARPKHESTRQEAGQ
jgi:hypothetical protein